VVAVYVLSLFAVHAVEQFLGVFFFCREMPLEIPEEARAVDFSI
jgi:hypothetical protein